MKNGKNELQNSQHENKRVLNKIQILILSLLVITTVTVGGTVAYLTTKTDSVVNTFEPSEVSCEVQEKFDGTHKKDINVKNTSDIEAYLRVKLVSYRVNDADPPQHIGGEAPINNFNLGDDWVKIGDYYYYTKPVAANGGVPATPLTNSLELTSSYNDADGGRQVIEVMAEAIQSKPVEAVKQAWDVNISKSGEITE